MRILVFTRAHPQFPWMSTFPHVRGHILATYLRQLGDMLVPTAAVIDADPVRGIERATFCDADRIAREAAERFSAITMARRVMAAIRAVA